MKEYIRLAGAVLSVITAVACTNDIFERGASKNVLTAVIDSDMVATKSILIDNPGEKIESFWEAGDRIGVFGGDAANVAFQVSEDRLSDDHKTADFTTEGDIPAGKLTAYSPYSEDVKISDGSIIIDFPAEQRYVLVHGVVQPDPETNIMLGEGSKADGMVFRSAVSILKIGQVFEETTVVRTVEFRDLSGASVCGEMSLNPERGGAGTIIGDGKVITLDLGDGVEFCAGSVRPLFLTVPARNYDKGFELTFIDDKGGKTVKTVGKTMGKTLSRGVVHLIGDISGSYAIEGIETKLKSNTLLMTPEVLDKIQVLDADKKVLYAPDGSICTNPLTGIAYVVPYLTLLVHEDLDPEVGKIMMFNQVSSELPSGGVYKVTSCEKVSDHFYEVHADPETNFAAGIEEMVMGTPLFDSDGSIIEDGGIELDLTSHLKSIKDAEGNDVEFSTTTGGEILFSEGAALQFMSSADTKAKMHATFNTPKVSLKHAKDNAEVSFGAQLSVATRLAIGIIEGELQYVHFVADPVFNLSASFTLKGEAEIAKSFHLLTLEFTPIYCGTIILTPSLTLGASVGVGGSLKFTASANYTYKMGSYGISYNCGDGLTARYQPVQPEPTEINPSIDGYDGTVYTYGVLSARPWIGVFGLFGMGLDANFKLSCGLGYNGAPRLFLQPDLELVPMVASLGGIFTHQFTDLTTNFEFDPIWELYLRPRTTGEISFYDVPSSEKYYLFSQMQHDGSSGLITQVPCGAARFWDYNVSMDKKVKGNYRVEARVQESEAPVSLDWFHYGSSSNTGYPLEQYIVSGIPHMYSFATAYSESMILPGQFRTVAREEIGSYEEGCDKKDFAGTFEISPSTASSGHAYWGELYLIGPDGKEDLFYSTWKKAKVYYFPNDFYGNPYEEVPLGWEGSSSD